MTEDTNARHFLRRFIARALVHKEPPQNLHISGDGWAPIAQILGIARAAAAREGIDATKMTEAQVLSIVMTSGGALEDDGTPEMKQPDTKDEKGELVPGATIPARKAMAIRAVVDRSEPKEESEDDDMLSQFDQSSRSEAAKALAAHQKQIETRQAQALARTKAAHEARNRRNVEAQAKANTAALSDVKNDRRIADPKDPTKLAKIAPPIKRLTNP